MYDLNSIINKVFNKFRKTVDLQPHQERFCGTEQDLVFFGGGAGYYRVL